MGYDTWHGGRIDLNKEPNEVVKKYFEAKNPNRQVISCFPGEHIKAMTPLEDCDGDGEDEYSDLWFLGHDGENGSKWFLEREECTRHSMPEDGLQYLIDKVFIPNDIVLNGSVHWQGEEPDDSGFIEVKENIINIFTGYTIYADSNGNLASDSVPILHKFGYAEVR